MKYKLDSLEGLSDEMKALYEEKDGAFYLKVEGLPQQDNSELDGLKNKVNQLLNEKKTAQEKQREAEEKAQREAEEAARKKVTLLQLKHLGKPSLSKQKQNMQKLPKHCKTKSTN